MAHQLIAAVLAWVSAHPGAAISVVFVIALAESIFLLGLLVPGAIFMFAFGALVGGHAVSGVAVFTAAVIGTLLGDSASYALGRRYQGRLAELPGLSRIPGGVARGEAFFVRHGGKGIVLGRLIGALRPVMPTVAGAAGLSIARFVVMDLIATALWAPIYIGPGIVFGASLDLAAQVATRLAILLLGCALAIWAITSAARFMAVAARSAARRHARTLMAWSARHRRLGVLGPALADPRQPEIPALAVAALGLLVVTVLIYWALWGLGPTRYPSGPDAVVFYLIGGLHTLPTDTLARILAAFGSPLIGLLFAALVALILILRGNRRAAGHWIVAVVFSVAMTALLRWLLAIAPPAVFFHGVPAAPLSLAGGGQDLILAATLYGLAGAMVGESQTEARQPYIQSATVAGVVMIALARLYLGLDWLSDSLIGLGLASIWVATLMIGYRRQRPQPVAGRAIAGASLVCLALAGGLALAPAGRGVPAHDPVNDGGVHRLADWPGPGYRHLPGRIQTLRGRPGARVNVQAAGDHDTLLAALSHAGWQAPPQLGLTQALTSLAPGASIDALAVWPRLHDGRPAAIVRVHNASDARRRWVLRLWPTSRITAGNARPLWIGIVDAQGVGHELHLLTTARDEAGYAAAARYLAGNLKSAGIAVRRPGPATAGPLLFWVEDGPDDAKVAPH